jgi:hypothetical protein
MIRRGENRPSWLESLAIPSKAVALASSNGSPPSPPFDGLLSTGVRFEHKLQGRRLGRTMRRHGPGRFTMDFVRSHSPGQSVVPAFAARAGVAALAALVMACSSSSNPVRSDAGTDSGGGKRPPSQDSGSDAEGDGDTDAGLCTPATFSCESFTVCCNGGVCVPTGQGDSLCSVPDSPPRDCLLAGESCSASEDCCNGAGNCGEGTTNTCL